MVAKRNIHRDRRVNRVDGHRFFEYRKPLVVTALVPQCCCQPVAGIDHVGLVRQHAAQLRRELGHRLRRFDDLGHRGELRLRRFDRMLDGAFLSTSTAEDAGGLREVIAATVELDSVPADARPVRTPRSSLRR